MAMVVKNNMGAQKTLNTLNKNSKALEKSLSKVSSGMKITSAQDDASGYGISEKMRVQVRALDQADQNIQNSMSMVKTAEGAVATTMDLIRTLKEKAIQAANDTNTDADRAVIQKEIEQCIDQIDDNALTTFNGKILLDGRYQPLHFQKLNDMEKVVRGLNSAWIEDAMELITDTYGINFNQNGNAAKYLNVEFVGGDTGIPVDSDMSTAIAWCGMNSTAQAVSYDGGTTWRYTYDKGDTLTLTFNLDIIKNIDVNDANGSYEDCNNQYLDRTIAHELTHAIMQSRLHGGTFFAGITSDPDSDNFVLPSYIIEGGTAEITHGADDTRFSSMLAAFADSNTLKTQVFDATGTGAAAPLSYGGGYAAMHYFANNVGVNPAEVIKNFMTALDKENTVSEAFNFASKGKWQDQFDSDGTLIKSARQAFEDAMCSDLDRWLNGGGTSAGFLTERCGLDFTNHDTGAITGKDSGGKLVKTAKNVVHEVGKTINWSMPNDGKSMIAGLEVRWPANVAVSTGGGSMVFHTGAKANESIHVGFMDMRARALGLYDEEGKKISVNY